MMLVTLVSACLVASAFALPSEWNQETRDQVLDIHNDYRRKEGGCQINKLEYDMELERQAKTWAEGCVFDHEQIKGRGENLAFNANKPRPTEKEMIHASSFSWFDEKRDPGYRLGQKSCGGACHYTQMVWGNTEKVGCWTTWCPSLRNKRGGTITDNAWYFVCFYTPMGNWDGEKPYETSCDTPCHDGQTKDNGLCVGKAKVPCVDDHVNCQMWAKNGDCNSNPDYMEKNCKKSCGKCQEEGEETGGDMEHDGNGGGETEHDSKTGGGKTGSSRADSARNRQEQDGSTGERREGDAASKCGRRGREVREERERNPTRNGRAQAGEVRERSPTRNGKEQGNNNGDKPSAKEGESKPRKNGGDKCKDDGGRNQCRTWSKYNGCVIHEATMATSCAKTCRLCRP